MRKRNEWNDPRIILNYVWFYSRFSQGIRKKFSGENSPKVYLIINIRGTSDLISQYGDRATSHRTLQRIH